LIIGLVVSALVLAACGSGNETPTPDVAATAAAMAEGIVDQRLTEVAQTEAARQPTATETLPPTEMPTETQAPPPAVTLMPTNANSGTLCLQASLIDETIPDDTQMAAGEGFEKSWTLTNTGTCTWTEDFSLVFHHGSSMGAPERVSLPGRIAPGESHIFTLNMNAPTTSGKHVGFWTLESADGTQFGVGESGSLLFWVQVVVPGPTPTSKIRDLAYVAGGSVNSEGEVDSTILAGDIAANFGNQGFFTFNFGNIPTDAVVTEVVLYLGQGYRTNGDPFGSLGCLNAIINSYGSLDASDYAASPGGAVWQFCTETSLQSATRVGGEAAIAAIQAAIPTGQAQFRLQFDNDTDEDGTPDYIIVSPLMKVNWYQP
jgi:hypothetical protein